MCVKLSRIMFFRANLMMGSKKITGSSYLVSLTASKST
ncbi:hypothetical protein PF005_g29409 [Phytophthora fragariae]|uniref:Uncharacterized protein n=1 Tax=Phytophthora fragariae TaxID=53985 RepID=A0A6A3QAE3_9STRA|nr:hypothetical protein PF007_g29204 [Phytophthora fragariae]KAE9071982.1 hypothetical protein PF006_g29029 [Phytophthora fragariae]KAE9165920.1 hypothetical protein PF005_g29409 [Phytophthora fragariae]